MPTRRPVKRFGWLPDIPDPRDLTYSAGVPAKDLPSKVDLRDKCPKEIYDQGELGSCTAQAIATAFQFCQLKQEIESFPVSRLFIYYNERVILGTEEEDSGAMIRDGIKSVAREGVPSETLWPYNIAKFRQKPPIDAYKQALDHQVVRYERVNRSLDNMRSCLADGYPFVTGFTAYFDFTSPRVARTGIVNMPEKGSAIWSGHAVLTVGYDDSSERFVCRNSYGIGWGQKGYFTIPYAYLTDKWLAGDFWTIRSVEDNSKR